MKDTICFIILMSLMLTSSITIAAETKKSKKVKSESSEKLKAKNLEYDINEARNQAADEATEHELSQNDTIAMTENIRSLRKELAALKTKHSLFAAKMSAEKKELTKKTIENKAQERINKDETRVINKEIAKLTDENKKLKSLASKQELASLKAQEILKNVKSTLATAKEKKEGLLDSIAKSEEIIKSSTQDIEKFSAEIKTTNSEIQNLKIQLVVVKQNQSDATIHLASTSKEAASLNQENKTQQEIVNKIEEEVADLQRMIKAGELVIKNARKVNEALIKRNNQAQLDKPKLQVKLSSIKTEYKSLVQQNKDLNTRLPSSN